MTAPAEADAAAQDETVGVGFLGFGGFGRFLAEHLTTLPARVVSVFDPALTARPDVLGQVTLAASAADLLRDPDVQVVVVATPPASHAELVLASLAAGKHVFAEKPLARTVAEAAAIADAAAAAGLLVQVDHVLLFSPIYRALRRLQQGTPAAPPLLGTLRRYAFENDASNEHLGPGHWFWDRELSGGIAVEHGVHFFAGASLLHPDQPVAVSGLTSNLGHPGVTDTFLISAVYADGATASYAHAFTHPDRAEQQLTRMDFGVAKALVEGWIPVRATMDVWAETAAAARWHELASHSDEVLQVPGFRLPGNATITVVDRAHGYPQEASSHDGTRDLSRHLQVVIDLGGEEAKGYLYGQGVRAAFSDLIRSIRLGGPVTSGPAQAVSTVVLAEAAQRSADERRVIEL